MTNRDEFTKLVRLADGTIVEVIASEYEKSRVGSGVVEQVRSTLKQPLQTITTVLVAVSEPVAKAGQEMRYKGIKMKEAEIDVHLSFDGDGQIYVARSEQNATIHIKLVLELEDRLSESFFIGGPKIGDVIFGTDPKTSNEKPTTTDS